MMFSICFAPVSPILAQTCQIRLQILWEGPNRLSPAIWQSQQGLLILTNRPSRWFVPILRSGPDMLPHAFSVKLPTGTQILCSAAGWSGMWNQLDGTKPMHVPSEQACFNESDEPLRCWHHHHLRGCCGAVTSFGRAPLPTAPAAHGG